MRWKNMLCSFVVCAALMICGFLYLDIRLAEFVSEKVGTEFSALGGRIQFAGPSVLAGVHHNCCELDRALVPGSKTRQGPDFEFPGTYRPLPFQSRLSSNTY